MFNPKRFVVTTTWLTIDDEEDRDPMLPENLIPKKTSVDMYLVTRIQEGWDKGTVELYFGEESFLVVEGTFKEWHKKHMEAIAEQDSTFKRTLLS